MENLYSINKYNSYHTNIIINYKLGNLSSQYLKGIPRSTIHNWKKTNISKYLGISDKSLVNPETLDLVKTVLRQKWLLKAAKCLYKIYMVKSALLDSIPKRTKIMSQHKSRILETINMVKDFLTLEKTLLYFNITYQQYSAWNRQTIQCKISITSNCLKQYPNQLQKKDIDTIRSYCQNPEYRFWSLDSIYYQAMRDGAIYLNLSTWYYYIRTLHLRYPQLKREKKRYGEGLRAEKPKDIIHADVTIYRPKDNSVMYIYLIVDNKSRFIMSHQASKDYKAEICLSNLKRAYSDYLYDIDHTQLITDGGNENKGAVLDFLDEPDIGLEKIIARKDIVFSNSMVEAANKKLKYQHLFVRHLRDYDDTKKYLEKVIPRYYNTPSGIHFGLTPKEVFEGAIPDKTHYKDNINNALKKRVEENRSRSCQIYCDE